MNNWLDRTERLIGTEKLNILKKSTIAIFGIGGVGSYVLEALARSGIENLIIIDKDIVDITNINRQLIATHSSIGQSKTSVAKKRLLDINPNCNVIAIKEFVNKENIVNILNKYNIDYIVDAIDTVSSKLSIIQYANDNNIKIISCMGTGNKLDATKFEITDINKTSVCPLSKVIRKELRKLNIPKLKVIYSKEEPKKINSNTPASISFVPSVAGLLIAGEVIRDIIN